MNSYLGEATVNFLSRNYLYTRLELVDKRDLFSHDELHQLGFGEDAHPTFRIGAYTFGYVRDLLDTGKLLVGVGGDVTGYTKPAALDPIYGSNPISYKFFFRIRPSRTSMSDHTGHTGHVMTNN